MKTACIKVLLIFLLFFYGKAQISIQNEVVYHANVKDSLIAITPDFEPKYNSFLKNQLSINKLVYSIENNTDNNWLIVLCPDKINVASNEEDSLVMKNINEKFTKEIVQQFQSLKIEIKNENNEIIIPSWGITHDEIIDNSNNQKQVDELFRSPDTDSCQNYNSLQEYTFILKPNEKKYFTLLFSLKRLNVYDPPNGIIEGFFNLNPKEKYYVRFIFNQNKKFINSLFSEAQEEYLNANSLTIFDGKFISDWIPVIQSNQIFDRENQEILNND